jgi:hypothetical protein
LHLARTILNKFTSYMILQFKLLMSKWFWEWPRVLQWWVQTTCSALAAYQTRTHGNVRCRNKVQTQSYILHFVSFKYFVCEKSYTNTEALL